MSQHSATRRAPTRKSRRAAQILRHTAVVGAGMASIGLTVAAGTYIVHEMAGAQRPDAELAAPPYQPNWNTGTPGTPPDYGTLAPIAEGIGLASAFTIFPAHPDQAAAMVTGIPASAEAAQQSPNSPGLSGRVRVGNAYVGAQVVPVQRNSLAITLETNAFGAAFDLVVPTGAREWLGIGPAGNTQLHTEFDTKRGDVSVVVSDTALGKVGVQLARHPAPAHADPGAVRAEQPGNAEQAVVSDESATAPQSTETDPATISPQVTNTDTTPRATVVEAMPV